MPATMVYRWRRPLMIAISILFMLLIFAQMGRADSFTFTYIGSSDFGMPSINNQGVVAYSTQGSIIISDGTSGFSVVDTSGEFSYLGPYPVINDQAVVAFGAELDTGQYGSFSTNGAYFISAGDGVSVNNQGTVVASGDTYVATYNPATGSNTIATSNTPAFSEFVRFPFPDINDNGTAAFEGVRIDGYAGIFTSDGSTTRTIADNSAFQTAVYYPSINNSGLVAFSGRPIGGVTGIYVGDGSSITTVAEEDGFISGFGVSAINDLGWVAYLGTGAGNATGIYLWDGTDMTRVLGVGDPLFGSTVTNTYFFTSGLNNSGQIALRAILEGGSSVIVRADPVPAPIPEPSTLTLLATGLMIGYGWRRRY